MKKKEDNIEKIFAQQSNSLGLTYENNQNEYFKTFIEDQSLYQKFKETALRLEEYLQIDDSSYCDILQGFMGSKQLFSYKGVELIQAWIVYKIKSTFKFKAGIKDILSVVIKIFNQKKITLKRCVDEIVKIEVGGPIKLLNNWRAQNKVVFETFEKEVTNNNFFINFSSSKIKSNQRVEQLKQITIQIKQVEKDKNHELNQTQTQKVDYSLIQLEKQGQLIFLQHDQLTSNTNLLELQIQKYIFHYFIKIYQQSPNHHKIYLQKFDKYRPLQLMPIQKIKQKLQLQRRQVPEAHFNRLIQLQTQIGNRKKQDQDPIKSKYKQIFRIWNSIKQELNVLNIFLLHHLIRNTEQSIKHIKDKNILFLIGPSGAGKTTMILRLLNYQLIETTVNELPTLAPKCRLKPQHSQLITSPQAKSTTKYIFSAQIDPQYVSEIQIDEQGKRIFVKQQLYLCDTPGFFDTSGVVVDIANGVGMINAVKCAKTVKPIVVISASMVGQKFQGVKQIGKIVSDLFHQYKKKQSASTSFIFNKFKNNQQFTRLQPGLLNILDNLSANDQSDTKYVKLLQTLYQNLRKNKDIIRFNPFHIDIKDIIDKLSKNPIQNPSNIFKYSFSSKSVLALKNYVQNKLNIILNLLSEDINHACYHMKQLKTLLQLVPNQDFKNEYNNLIKKICNMSQGYYLRFKYILDEDVLKGQANASEIQQLKKIYDILKSFKAFHKFRQIEVYAQEDLLNLIDNVSQKLQNTYKQYKFTNSNQAQFKKTIKIIKCLSDNFNPQLFITLKKFIKYKYESFNKQIERLVYLNQFNNQFKQLYQKYQNVCTYYELVNQSYQVKRPIIIINQKYESLKQPLKALLLTISKLFKNKLENNKKQFNNTINQLTRYYTILQSIFFLNVSPIIKQQNLRNAILQKIKALVKKSSQKCEQMINLKQLKHQSIKILKNNLDYLGQLINFPKVKDQTELIVKHINSMIKRSLQIQICNLQQINLSITDNKEINPKTENLDLTLFKLKNYSQIIDFSQKNHIRQLQQAFFDQFPLFLLSLTSKIQKMKFGIKTILKLDEVTNLIRRIKELRYLKFIKQNFQPNQLKSFQKITQKCYQKLIEPYKEIKQCLSQNGQKIKITKKLLNQISNFIQFDLHVNKMMNGRDYKQNIIPAKQNYQKLIIKFMDQLLQQIKAHLQEISGENKLIYNCEKTSLINFKKTFNLLSYTLKDDNVFKQLNRLDYQSQFSDKYNEILNLLQENQKSLLKEFYQNKNGKDFQNSLERIRRFCYQMKQFDVQIGQQNNFSEIITLVNNQYSKKEKQLSNKLIYIFTESSVDFKQLRQIFAKNQGNRQLIQEIMDKIKRYDKNFYQEIDGMKKYSEDLLFQNENLNYIKLVKNAYVFYKEIHIIARNKIQDQHLSLNIQYFKLCLDPFVQNYLHLYKKIMENVFKLKYNKIPQKIELFFTILQQLVSQLLPIDYKNIKDNIVQHPFPDDFNIRWPNLTDKSITFRICYINQILRQSLQNSLTKVLNIQSKSSVKYYECLQVQQKRQYLKKLQDKFEKQIEIYQQNARDGLENQDTLNQFVDIIPDQEAKSKLKRQFSQKKAKIQFEKKAIQRSLNQYIESKDFDEAVKIYKEMNQNDQNQYKTKIIGIIVEDFGLIINGQMDKQQIFENYKKNCIKYEEKTMTSQFYQEYQRLKQQFQSLMVDKIRKAIFHNKSNLSVNDFESFKIIKQNNQMIKNAYILLIDKEIEDIGIFNQIEEYFKNIIIQFTREQRKFYNVYGWEIQELQKYIRNKYFIAELIKVIVDNQFTYNKQNILNLRSNSQDINFIWKFLEEKEPTKKCLQTIATQILKIHRQISNFTFSQFIEKTTNLANIKELSEQYLKQVGQKVNLLLKIEQTYNKCYLYKLEIDNNTKQLFNLQLFKQNINIQLNKAFQQIDAFQKNPNNKISIRFNLITDFCQMYKNNANNQKDTFYFINKINHDLQERLLNLIHKYKGQIQIFNQISKPKSKGISLSLTNKSSDALTKSQVRFCSQQSNIEKAQQIIGILIIMQIMQDKIFLHRQTIKQKTLKMIEQIKNNRYLFKIIMRQMKNKQHILQITKILNKYFQFREIYDFKLQQAKKKDIQVFLQELKKKNQKFEKNNFFVQDYKNFQNSFNFTISKYKNQDPQTKIKTIANDIINGKQKSGKSQIIGKICGLYSIMRQSQNNFKLHPGQYMGIVLLLHNIQDKQQGLQNKILQIPPGEGKSVILVITACYLALKGKSVYQICQTQYLVKRDQHLFKQLLQTLKITHLIKYYLLKEMIQRQLFKGATKQLIKTHILKDLSNSNKQLKDQMQILLKYISKPQEKNVIILDQIDTLFSQNFQGKIYEPTLSITDEGNNNQIKNVYQFIYKRSKTQYLTLQSLQKQQIYQKLIAKYKSVEIIIKNQILAMLKDVHDQRKINQCYQTIKINIKNPDKEENGYQKVQQDFIGYHQCFAYLKLRDQALVNNQKLKNNLKLFVKIGAFSYSQLLKNAGKIIGVSGSLGSKSKMNQQILQNNYKIKNVCYFPSIYHKNNFFIQQKQIVQSQSINTFFKSITQQIDKYFKDSSKKTMLILVKNNEDILYMCQLLSQFIRQQSNLKKLKINHLLVSQKYEGIQTILDRILCQDKVLIFASKQFSKGIDYKDYCLSEGLAVIQTYLPENQEEYDHARGRTARAGRPGIFKLIISYQEMKNIKDGQTTFQKNIVDILEIKRKQKQQLRKNSLKNCLNLHNKTLDAYQKGYYKQFLQQINTVQLVKQSKLIIFGVQGSFYHQKQYKQWLINTLQKYQQCIRQHSLNIELKYQACFYGNFINFSQYYPLIKKSNICKLLQFKDELKNLTRPQRVIQQKQGLKAGGSSQLFMKHISQMSQTQQIASCFVWTHQKILSWDSFKKTNLFKKKLSEIKQQLNIKYQLKTLKQYFKDIKSKNIPINFIGLSMQIGFLRQIQQINRMFQKEKSLLQLKQVKFGKQLNKFFLQKMKQVIPQLKNQQYEKQII